MKHPGKNGAVIRAIRRHAARAISIDQQTHTHTHDVSNPDVTEIRIQPRSLPKDSIGVSPAEVGATNPIIDSRGPPG